MKIQLVTFPGCPNAAPLRRVLHAALARLELAAVEEVDTTAPQTPAALRAWPSPTILVDGADLDGLAAPPAGSEGACRWFQLPSVDALEAKLRAHQPPAGPTRPRTRWFGGGALLAALAASACCLGPVVLATVGLSGVGLAVALRPWRPLLLALTALLIGAGLWTTFRARRGDAACCAVPATRRAGRWIMIAVAALTLALATYPWWAGEARTRARGATAPARATATAHLAIDGITCAACARDIARRLGQVPGVATVEVDADHATATIRYDPTRTTAAELADVVSALASYEARPLTP